MQNTNKIKLNIKSEDSKFYFEDEISLSQSAFIISYLSNSEVVKEQLPVNITSNQQVSTNDTKEILNQLERYQPKSNVEKLTVFADYLNSKKINGEFSEEDLKSLFEQTNQKMPENFKRDISIAIERGVIFKIKDKEVFITTLKTEKELQNLIDKQNIDESLLFKPKKRKRGLTERAGFNNEITKIPFTGTIQNIKYKDLKQGADRILWILYYLKQNNIDSASIKDIEYLSEKLGTAVKSKYFSMYNKGNLEDGKVAQVDNKFSLLESGINYINSITL